VIRYFDAFIENDKLFIVTELARGGDIGAKVILASQLSCVAHVL
jgi:hypothetical protein